MDFVRPIEAIIPGAQGRLLAALARVETPLNLRTLARVSRVSLAQASRVLPQLVELGLIKRTEVPPAALFELKRHHLAVQIVLRLGELREQAIEEMARGAAKIKPAPESVILFGSLARGDALADSDIDILVVRPTTAPDDDDVWRISVQQWVNDIRAMTGNQVNFLEVDGHECGQLLRSRRAVWRAIAGEGVVLHGRSVEGLSRRKSA